MANGRPVFEKKAEVTWWRGASLENVPEKAFKGGTGGTQKWMFTLLGKHTKNQKKNYGQSPFATGKSTINRNFNSKLVGLPEVCFCGGKWSCKGNPMPNNSRINGAFGDGCHPTHRRVEVGLGDGLLLGETHVTGSISRLKSYACKWQGHNW